MSLIDAPFSALTAPSPPPAAVALNAPSSSTLLQQPSEHVVPAAVVASIMPSSSLLHHPTLPPAAGGLSLNLSEQNVSQILQRTNARRAQPGSSIVFKITDQEIFCKSWQNLGML